ncbi:hypothetical protein SCHPADRAFT_620260 [Schizopora paradoxa]|uniref:Protein kinase domain-containing protein n=1 Tax=Schizopora paradoxa TaxID=27342 RepID=A0A0H2R8I1_9AGAM|nr:hypothetical protein SCHPADRAFT_620260 [Schizopora paradoxa]
MDNREDDESSSFDVDEARFTSGLYYTQHHATYGALRDELRGRIELEQTSVWDHLKLNAIDDELVKECSKQLQTTCKSNILELKQEISYYQKHGLGKVEHEVVMVPPLIAIFDFIQEFTLPSLSETHKTVRRLVRPFKSKTNNEEDADYEDDANQYSFGFPKVFPTFELLNIEDKAAPVNEPRSWNIKDGFCIARIKPLFGPSTPANPNRNSEILLQSANYVRLHLSSRPFLLFSIGLLIYGTRFSVCIFDRAGVRISLEHDMFLDTEIFIRVVRSLTCVLSAQDIGQDPTVRLVKTPSEPDFYIIKPIGEDKRSWCTIGSPIWSSLSLFGRGTIVWKVFEYNEESNKKVGPTMIMKTAWRAAQRDAEASLSRYVTAIAHQYPEVSVAEFVTGGDVYMEGGSPPDMILANETSNDQEPDSGPSVSVMLRGTVITVPYLRGAEVMEGDSPILHRVITSTVGRPLWEYKDEIELARGFIAILKSHKKLCDLNVLHRDISPGNILLAENPDNVQPGHEAFLSDFELARVGDGVVESDDECVGPQKKRRKIQQTEGTRLQAPITGTLHFMAFDLLHVFITEARMPGSQIEIKQTIHHDLESIVLVFAYTQFRKMINIASASTKYETEKKLIQEEFKKSFGLLRVRDIRDQRRLKTALGWIHEKSLASFNANHMHKKLIEVMDVIFDWMEVLYWQREEEERKQRAASRKFIQDPRQPTQKAVGPMEVLELTHELLINLFEQVLEN